MGTVESAPLTTAEIRSKHTAILDRAIKDLKTLRSSLQGQLDNLMTQAENSYAVGNLDGALEEVAKKALKTNAIIKSIDSMIKKLQKVMTNHGTLYDTKEMTRQMNEAAGGLAGLKLGMDLAEMDKIAIEYSSYICIHIPSAPICQQ